MSHDLTPDFVAGATVALKSGGPALTVLGTDGDQIKCVFYSEEIGEFREVSLAKIALIHVDIEEDFDEEDEDFDDEDEEDEEDDKHGK